MTKSSNQPLAGKKAIVFGVANERSLAWASAQQLADQGAEVALTYQGEALERRVRPLAEKINAKLIIPCDVTQESSIQAAFQQIQDQWGELSVLVHSIAFAQKEDLEGRFIDTSKSGFLKAMEISAYSLVELARQAEPLMKDQTDGSIVTMSYYGAEKVIPNYNVMGVAKATLEACVRYLAFDLGPRKIRVNAISAGPVKTLAAAGIRGFKGMLAEAQEKTPLKENIDASDVGALCAFLSGPGGRHITGSTYYVDSGAHIMGV